MTARNTSHSLWIIPTLCLTIGMALDATSAEPTAGPRVPPDQWPQWGGTAARNNTPDAEHLPVAWDTGRFDFRTGEWQGASAQHIQWVTRLGSESYCSPVIAGGKIFCATNNGAGYLKRYSSKVDLGCLLAFRQEDGQFLWQHSAEKLEAGRDIDWPEQGICATPLVEADRLWVVTNRGEVVCLDTEGFHDGENDGPFTSEPSDAIDESDAIWYFDMMGELGTLQHNMSNCSVTAVGDLLLVNTSNGVDSADQYVPAPQAPSFIALDKRTGKLVWADNSPGENILHGQWASPACAVIDGVPQAIFPGGDGWLYSFLARATDDGKPELLWKFDCNPKESVWDRRGERNSIISTPVIQDGLVYLATGKDPEAGECQGTLWCIDPSKRGDTSPELVVDADGNPVGPRRLTAVDPEAGEQVKPNPNSAAVWQYRHRDADGDGRFDFEETMHGALGKVAVKDGLLVITDFVGLIHCLDSKTGQVHWTHDSLAEAWGSPLIADGKIYVGDGDGDVTVFELAAERNILAENNMGDSVFGSPVAVGQTLYIATRSNLIAIRLED